MKAARLDRRSLTEQTYDWLRQLIFTGKLRPGQRLDIDQLAKELGISRTPVRGALHRLAFEGLAVVTARRGTTVSALTLDDVGHAYAARRVIEPSIAEAAAAIVSDDAIDDLRRIQAQWERIDPEDVYRRFAAHSRYAELDVRFHSRIAAMLRNRRIDQVVRQLAIQRHVAPYLFGSAFPGPARRMSEHRAILDALERRDGTAARDAMRAHIDTSERELVEFLTEGPLRDPVAQPAPTPRPATRRGGRARRSA